MLTFIFFRPLSENYPTLEDAKVLDLALCESYQYRKHRYEVGDFTLVVPANIPRIGEITTDMLILAVDECTADSLVISSVKNDGVHVTFKGYDMKILLKWRVTLFPQEEIEAGTYGYDVFQGTTGEVIEHFIDYNCISSDDEDRNIFGLTLREMRGGLQEDTYMSRLEPLNKVVETICKTPISGMISICPQTTTAIHSISSRERTGLTGRAKIRSAYSWICCITPKA